MTVNPSASIRWLGHMRDAIGGKFMAGIALYAGDEVLTFGDRLIAAPISALWSCETVQTSKASQATNSIAA